MIRPYRIQDKKPLLDLLRLNTPQYFDPSEEKDFIEYLDRFADNYFVVEENGTVIGCGGINYSEDKLTARISWDIIHPDHQGKGIGKKLTLFRIAEIKKDAVAKTIIVRTSQLAFNFYKKTGFILGKKQKDYWAKGFDLYHMKMTINNV